MRKALALGSKTEVKVYIALYSTKFVIDVGNQDDKQRRCLSVSLVQERVTLALQELFSLSYVPSA